MLDQIQVLNVFPFLSTLLGHPDVQEGIREGIHVYQEYLNEDHEHAWAEEQIISFVSQELGAEQYQRSIQLEQRLGCAPTPYLQDLGFVLGYLDQALAAKA